MDRTLSRLPAAAAYDPLEHALLEINAAIALVVSGVATTVTLCCLEAAEGAAFTGAVWAQTAGIAFCLRRDPPTSVSLVIGPRLLTASAKTGLETGA